VTVVSPILSEVGDTTRALAVSRPNKSAQRFSEDERSCEGKAAPLGNDWPLKVYSMNSRSSQAVLVEILLEFSTTGCKVDRASLLPLLTFESWREGVKQRWFNSSKAAPAKSIVAVE
jgi:hypothetical protein